MPVGGPQRCKAVDVQRYANGRRWQPPPPPLEEATQKSQINTVPAPTVAWTRPEMPRFKKRRVHGELVQERGI